MKIEKVEIDKIKQHPQNPRVHPESEINKLEESIKRFGWTNPILISKDGYIIAGHARLEAAKKMGLNKIPALKLDLEGKKAKAYMVADNKIQENTLWDMKTLSELMTDIKDTDLLLATGFEGEEIDNLLNIFDDNFTRPEPTQILKDIHITETEKVADRIEETKLIEVDENTHNRKEKENKVETWKEKKGVYETGNWLCVEFYGQGIRFDMVKEMLENAGAMITGHEIDSDFFYSLIMEEGD